MKRSDRVEDEGTPTLFTTTWKSKENIVFTLESTDGLDPTLKINEEGHEEDAIRLPIEYIRGFNEWNYSFSPTSSHLDAYRRAYGNLEKFGAILDPNDSDSRIYTFPGGDYTKRGDHYITWVHVNTDASPEWHLTIEGLYEPIAKAKWNDLEAISKLFALLKNRKATYVQAMLLYPDKIKKIVEELEYHESLKAWLREGMVGEYFQGPWIEEYRYLHVSKGYSLNKYKEQNIDKFLYKREAGGVRLIIRYNDSSETSYDAVELERLVNSQANNYKLSDVVSMLLGDLEPILEIIV